MTSSHFLRLIYKPKVVDAHVTKLDMK
jgi:hypothetical protein